MKIRNNSLPKGCFRLHIPNIEFTARDKHGDVIILTRDANVEFKDGELNTTDYDLANHLLNNHSGVYEEVRDFRKYRSFDLKQSMQIQHGGVIMKIRNKSLPEGHFKIHIPPPRDLRGVGYNLEFVNGICEVGDISLVKRLLNDYSGMYEEVKESKKEVIPDSDSSETPDPIPEIKKATRKIKSQESEDKSQALEEFAKTV